MHVCGWCGESLRHKKRRDSRYCDRTHAKLAQHNGDKYVVAHVEKIACAQCSVWFRPITRRTTFCSDQCFNRSYRLAHGDKVRGWAREHYARHRAKILAEVKAWAKAHPEYVRANSNARKLRVKRNTPAWADMAAIVDFYMRCPNGHEVDHFYPLKGKAVSGLHVRENLQYLPMVANRKKGARVDILQEAA
jgi:hypothetical protein